jgi:hypothetical protein
MHLARFIFAASAALSLASIPSTAQYNQGPPPPPPPQGRPWQYDNGQPGVYRPEWDRLPPPQRGACFFTDANFSGHRFCVRAGDRLPFLPEGYGHSISSIRSFGGARITAFARRDFQGERADFRTMPDLGYTSNGPYRGWNDRISSVVVR